MKFLIVGEQATIYYGVRRGTGDLDILIEPTKENGVKLLQAFKALDLRVDEIKPEEFEQPIFLGLGFESDAVNIFTTTPGLNFDDSYANGINDRGVAIKIVALEDLIRNKEKLNREGDKKKLDEYDVLVLKKDSKRKHRRD